MQKNYSKKQSGFTLIEMIIVIAIVAIISAITLPGLNDGSKFFKFNEAVRQTGDFYREAQSYATNIRVNPNDDEFIGKFGVYVDEQNKNEIILYADSESGDTLDAYDAGEEVKSLIFGGGIEVSDVLAKDTEGYDVDVGFADILFKRPFVDAHIITGHRTPQTVVEVEIQIQNEAGQIKSVIIGATGYILSE